jgi:hypothetical protein
MSNRVVRSQQGRSLALGATHRRMRPPHRPRKLLAGHIAKDGRSGRRPRSCPALEISSGPTLVGPGIRSPFGMSGQWRHFGQSLAGRNSQDQSACSCPTFSADYGFPGRHRRHTGPRWTRNAAMAAGQPRQHAAFDSNPVDNLRGIDESECGSRGQSRFSKGST